MIPERDHHVRTIASLFKVPTHMLKGPSGEGEASAHIDEVLRADVRQRLEVRGIWGMPVIVDELYRHGPVVVGQAEAQRLYDEAERLVKELARGVDDPSNPGLYCPCNPNRPEEPQMPATTYPASPRQISYINALRSERGLGELDEATASALTGGRNGSASSAISTLLDMPRVGGSSAVALNASEQLPRPNADSRTGRMLLAGGVVATVTLPNGRHVTLKVRTRRPQGSGWTNAAPGEEGARTSVKTGTGRYLGSIRGWEIRWARGISSVEVKDAIRALFGYAGMDVSDHSGDYGAYRVQVESRCGRCTRQLTDPVSIARGIGPECYGHDTGSRHVTAADIQSAADESQARIEATPERDWDAEFAARERVQEQAAFTSDPDYQRFLRNQQRPSSRVEQAREELALQIPAPRSEFELARETIALALKAAAEDEEITEARAQSALATFDRLAAR